MTTKIDVTNIVREHFQSLRDAGTGKVSKLDVLVMFGGPAFVTALSLYMGLVLDDEHVGTLVGAFSIFSGFLFNVIVLIYGFEPPGANKETAEDQKILLSQTFANISFSILVTISIILSLISILYGSEILKWVCSAIFLGLSVNFALSLLMVLKRIYVLLGLKFQ